MAEIPRPRAPPAPPAPPSDDEADGLPWPSLPFLDEKAPLAPLPASTPVSLTATPALCSEGYAMLVLARHSARLGPSGEQLEKAVKGCFWGVKPSCGCWAFLFSEDKMAKYRQERQKFLEMHRTGAQKNDIDFEVLHTIWAEFRDFKGLCDERPVPEDWKQRSQPLSPGGAKLPVHQIRFAHDSQSEFFVHGHQGHTKRSVLQLAVELLSGHTRPQDVESFDVCWHEGNWYSRSGNRRLAAMRLAQHFWREKFAELEVRIVPADRIFSEGAEGKRPKLTTQLNGMDCEGRWLRISETGETVGHRAETIDWSNMFGADLLMLLPGVAQRIGRV